MPDYSSNHSTVCIGLTSIGIKEVRLLQIDFCHKAFLWLSYFKYFMILIVNTIKNPFDAFYLNGLASPKVRVL